MTTTATPRATPEGAPDAGSRPAGAIDPRGPQLAAALTAVVLVAVLLLGTITGKPSTSGDIEEGVPNVTQIARLLFTDYLWAFEITSVLLVIAVVGAVVLARHRRDDFVDADVVDVDEPALDGEAAS